MCELEEKINAIKENIKIDDYTYSLKIIPLNDNMWEVSYFRLNSIGGAKNEPSPVLKYFISETLSDAVEKMCEWRKNFKNN